MKTFSITDENTGIIIAYVNFYVEADHKTVHIVEAYTKESCQGKGYFKKILSNLKIYCEENNYTMITLTAAQICQISNDNLMEIYKKCGFISSKQNKYRMHLNVTPSNHTPPP